MGRSSKYSQELADKICGRLIEGESLNEICRSEGMPNKVTVCRWLAVNAEFRNQYAQAREMQAEMMADELLDIADDGRNDWMERQYGDQVIEVTNQEAIQRSKLRVDARKWIAAKLLPKKFGEKVGVEHSGSLQLGDIKDFTDEQLAALAVRLGASPTPGDGSGRTGSKEESEG